MWKQINEHQIIFRAVSCWNSVTAAPYVWTSESRLTASKKKVVKEYLSASTSKDSFISSNVEWSPLYQCVYKLSGLSRGQTPPHSPLPFLIKLIQSGACVRAGPHYLRLSGPGRPPTPPSLSPRCANASDRGSRWPHIPPVPPPPRGSRGRTAGEGIKGDLGLLLPPPCPAHTQEAPTHWGVCPLHSFNLVGLNMGSQDLHGSLRGF